MVNASKHKNKNLHKMKQILQSLEWNQILKWNSEIEGELYDSIRVVNPHFKPMFAEKHCIDMTQHADSERCAYLSW